MFNGIKKLRQKKMSSDGPEKGEKTLGYSKGQARREEILAGLISALEQGELRNPSLRAIGKKLRMESAHILYYFGSREELMQAVIRRWDEDYTGSGSGNGGDGSWTLTLDNYVEAIRGNLARPGIVHLYLTFAAEAVDPLHPAHDFVERRFERAKNELSASIRLEQDKGRIAHDRDPDVEARLLIALADGLQLQSLIDPNVDAAGHLGAAIKRLRQ